MRASLHWECVNKEILFTTAAEAAAIDYEREPRDSPLRSFGFENWKIPEGHKFLNRLN